jgi:hypothetical protein
VWINENARKDDQVFYTLTFLKTLTVVQVNTTNVTTNSRRGDGRNDEG